MHPGCRLLVFLKIPHHFPHFPFIFVEDRRRRGGVTHMSSLVAISMARFLTFRGRRGGVTNMSSPGLINITRCRECPSTIVFWWRYASSALSELRDFHLLIFWLLIAAHLRASLVFAKNHAVVSFSCIWLWLFFLLIFSDLKFLANLFPCFRFSDVWCGLRPGLVAIRRYNYVAAWFSCGCGYR